MRLIDADTLRDEMQWCIEHEMYDKPSDYLEEIDDAPTVHEWIPVSKRLPKEGERVLVTAALERVMVAHYGKMFFEKERGNVFYLAGEDGDADITDVVVAWMPLPEPYEEVK